MSRVRRVAKNSIVLGFQQIVVNILSIVVVGYLARKLGKSDYGVFSLAFTFSAFFAFLGHLGLRTLTIREVAKERERAHEYISKVIPARLCLIAIMTTVIPLAAIVLDYNKVTIIIAIAAISTMFDQMSRILSDIFQAHEEMGKVALRDVIVRLFTGITSIAFLYLGYRLIVVSWIYVIGSFLGLLLNIYLYNNRFSWPKLIFDFDFIRTNIKEGLSYMVLGMLNTMYISVDVLIISKLLDMQSVGVYNASANLFYRLTFVADAIATASFPAISQLYWKSKTEASDVLTKSLSGILLISLPIAVGGWMLADDIIVMIYGDGFSSSTDIFKILIIAMPFMFLSLQLHYSLGAIKLQNIVLKIMVLLLITNILVNILIIPKYGLKGAASVTLLTEILGFVFLLSLALKYFFVSGILKALRAVILPLGIMVFVVFNVSKFGLIISIFSGAISFLASLLVVGRVEVLSFISTIKKI